MESTARTSHWTALRRAVWISSSPTYPSHTHKDDMYHTAKECSRGWRTSHNGRVGLLLVSHLLQRPTTPTNVMRCLRCSCRLLSCCLAIRCSILRWTTSPTSSHCALGRPVGKRLYAYTLVQSYSSHTTASTCRILACSLTTSGPGVESQLASKAA